MTALETIQKIKDPAKGFNSLYKAKAREHVGDLISLGRVWPATKAQAVKVARKGYFDVIYNTDIEELIEPLMNKHGLKGDYSLTKSKRFCRLNNFNEFIIALKKEFNF